MKKVIIIMQVVLMFMFVGVGDVYSGTNVVDRGGIVVDHGMFNILQGERSEGCNGCVEIGVNNLEEFKLCVLFKCSGVKLNESMTINEPIPVNYSAAADGLTITGDESVKLTVSHKDAVFNNVKFDVPVKTNVACTFIDSKFSDEATLANAILSGKSTILGDSVPRFRTVSVKDGQIDVNSSLSTAVTNASFKLSSEWPVAVNIASSDVPQKVLLIGNSYYSDQYSINVDTVISRPLSADFPVPDVALKGLNENNYEVKMNNEFTLRTWGIAECQGIHFEPYFVYMNDNNIRKLISLGSINFLDDDNYLKIDKTQTVRIDDDTTLPIENGKIAVLAHCMGYGTTAFSNIIKLSVLGGACTQHSDCIERQVCVEGVCADVAGTEAGAYQPPECTRDEQCAAGEECRENVCIDKDEAVSLAPESSSSGCSLIR